MYASMADVAVWGSYANKTNLSGNVRQRLCADPRASRKGRIVLTTSWEISTQPIPWAVALCVTLVAAASDLHSRRIPNLLTGPVFLAGLAWWTLTVGLAGLAESVTASVVLALPYVLLFVFAGGGAGDAKLMAALGAWMGFVNGLVVLFCVALAGVVCAIAVSMATQRLRIVLVNVRNMIGRVAVVLLITKKLQDTSSLIASPDEMRTMPYGISIFVGVCTAAGAMFLWHAA